MNTVSAKAAVGEAHSKLILFGEHAVVYGKPAIAIPFPLRARCKVERSSGAIGALLENRKALQKLGEASGISLETEKLKALADLARDYRSGKASGAGGGDCGIAFVKGGNQKQELYSKWEAAGICPLALSVSKAGVSVLCNKQLDN